MKDVLRKSIKQIQEINAVPPIEQQSDLYTLKKVLARAVHEVILEEAQKVLSPDQIEDAVIEGTEQANKR